MERKIAFDILKKYIKKENYILHSEAVEAIMRKLATKVDSENVESWVIAKGYPDQQLKSVKVSSILKRFKENRFSRSASRPYMLEIEHAGMSLEKFATLALEALCEIDIKLGL